VSVQDNFFFDLGGHSLLAARMVSELRQEPQWQALSMLDVYRHPTLESLATAIESAVPVGYLAGSPLMGLYCRLMGARIGRNVHLDADGFAIYDLLEIGDDASVGVDAILPPGTVIGDNCRIGCLSLPPPNPADALREDTAWLGSPALFLPQRQRNTAFTEAQTFQPPLRLRAARAAIEFVRILLPTTDFSEFDLVRIGDDVALNNACTLQTHLFEDRVMKMSTIEIAARARVGTGTLLLYDTRMEAGSSLGDLSLLMKGETLPAGTRWEGIPARVADTNRSTPT
jgi:acetyltransferase-like isoleucine patch superfamily enzyme